MTPITANKTRDVFATRNALTHLRLEARSSKITLTHYPCADVKLTKEKNTSKNPFGVGLYACHGFCPKAQEMKLYGTHIR